MQRDIKKNTIIRDINIPFSTRQIKHEKTHKEIGQLNKIISETCLLFLDDNNTHTQESTAHTQKLIIY